MAENSPSALPPPKSAGVQMLVADVFVTEIASPDAPECAPPRHTPNHLEMWKKVGINTFPNKGRQCNVILIEKTEQEAMDKQN